MRYHNITKDDMLNGEGLRVVLWVSGCLHKCRECQNPFTWDVNQGLVFDRSAKKEIEEQLEKNYISGITFSGGDPLHPENKNEIYELAKEFKEKYPQKTIWLYTGSLWEEIKEDPIMEYLDVVIDGEFVVEKKDTLLRWRGSGNQRVIDVKKSRKWDEVVLYETK